MFELDLKSNCDMRAETYIYIYIYIYIKASFIKGDRTSTMFNKTYLNNNLLPKYTLFDIYARIHTQTQTHTRVPRA